MDPWRGRYGSIPNFNGYQYAANTPINGIDPTGHFFASLVESVVNLAVRAIVHVINFAVRIFPAWQGLQVFALRALYWTFDNALKIELSMALGALALDAGAAFLDDAAKALIDNTDDVPTKDGAQGDWVEAKVKANATQYEIIDDHRYRNGLATSIKTSGKELKDGTIASGLLKEINKEAQTLASRTSDWRPRKGFDVPPLPMANTPATALLQVIPENHAHFLSNQQFRLAVRDIAIKTRTVISVVPLRGWIKK